MPTVANWINVDEKPRCWGSYLVTVVPSAGHRFVSEALWVPKHTMPAEEDSRGKLDERDGEMYIPEGWYAEADEETVRRIDGHVVAWTTLPRAYAGKASNVAPAVGSATIEGMIPEIHAWQLETFPQATALSKAKHLLKEAHELVENPTDGEEMADVLMLLIGIASVSGVNLTEELRKKFEKNKARKWGKPDADGVVLHVKEGGDGQ